MIQLTFDAIRPLEAAPRDDRPASIDDRFAAFHRRNPQVYAELRRMALDLRARGFERYSIDALMHTVRWRSALELGPDGEWKLNDHYTSRYARLLMGREPALDGFFATRALRGGGDQ